MSKIKGVGEAFVEKLKLERLDKMWDSIFKYLYQSYYITVYLFVLTITTVGYGDRISMPDFETHLSDL